MVFIQLQLRDTTGHCGNHVHTINIQSEILAPTYPIVCNQDYGDDNFDGDEALLRQQKAADVLLQQALKNLALAQDRYTNALNTYNTAQTNFNTATTSIKNAGSTLASAQNSYNIAENNMHSAQAKLSAAFYQAQKADNIAESNKKYVQNGYNNAQAAYKVALDDLERAKISLSNAQNHFKQAQYQFNNAKIIYQKTQNNYNLALSGKNSANEALVAATQVEKLTSQALIAAQNSSNSANNLLNTSKSAYSNAQSILTTAQYANNQAQSDLIAAKASYLIPHTNFDQAQQKLKAAQQAVYNAQCQKAEANRLLALSLAYHPVHSLPSTLQYYDTIYADITFDCKTYNFPSCTGAERVRSIGTNTILLYSGRTVLFGGCTNIAGGIHKDQYISWRGVTIKGNTHAHHISCY